MSFELRIARTGPNSHDGINRHTWISFSLNTPALRRCDDEPWRKGDPDEPQNGPIFQLGAPGPGGSAPRMFWRDGEIVARGVDVQWIPDLEAIASQLEAYLVGTDGKGLSY